jgi:hypothetical protein
MSRIPPKPVCLTISFLNSLILETREKTDLGEHRFVMLAEEEDSSSLELGEDGVTDPPPTDLPGGADDEGRLDMDGNSGTHFSSRSTTIPNQRGIAVKSSVEGAAKTWAAQQKVEEPKCVYTVSLNVYRIKH